jgi:hypothetical protein
MWPATYTQGNRGDSWLLMVKSQIVNLISGFSFGHNLCFNCPNGSCKPIVDIYVPNDFQKYKELFNPMSFGAWNCLIKIQESIETLTPKVRAHLGVWRFIPSHFFTLPGAWNVTPGLHSWPTPLLALAFVVSLRLRLCRKVYKKSLVFVLLMYLGLINCVFSSCYADALNTQCWIIFLMSGHMHT